VQTQFELFAATSLMGTAAEAPPRRNGELLFNRPWEGRAFGMAIALSKKGHYEWEDFRQELIGVIAQWEASHCKDDPSWDYYQRWLQALECMAIESDLISNEELAARTAKFLEQENA
jgi:nitrile hydratase accessory protein